jgi:hypothetical protein
MQRLLKKHQLNAEHEYFDLCIFHHSTGTPEGRKKAMSLFEALPKKSKKVMLTYILNGGCNGEHAAQKDELLQFFINCL